jgi:hypothetical protein
VLPGLITIDLLMAQKFFKTSIVGCEITVIDRSQLKMM